jgi:DNA-binding transcriptional ArsR family regulator
MTVMAKVTLDRDAFKALASDTRLDILRSLDGKKMTVTELSKITNMNKATLHEHLGKLTTVGLIKRVEREGHKWVYYKLSWKGSSLLHPENNRIVVMFSATIMVLIAGIVGFINYISAFLPQTQGEDPLLYAPTKGAEDMNELILYGAERSADFPVNPYFLYITIICIIVFLILFIVSYKRYQYNKKPKL